MLLALLAGCASTGPPTDDGAPTYSWVLLAQEEATLGPGARVCTFVPPPGACAAYAPFDEARVIDVDVPPGATRLRARAEWTPASPAAERLNVTIRGSDDRLLGWAEGPSGVAVEVALPDESRGGFSADVIVGGRTFGPEDGSVQVQPRGEQWNVQVTVECFCPVSRAEGPWDPRSGLLATW